MMNIVLCVLASLALGSRHSGQAEDGPRAVVTLQPNWPKIYREEKITLTCEIEDGGDTEWEYTWRTNSSIRPPDQRQYHMSAYVFHNGHYRCRGKDASSKGSRTKWSRPVKLKVHGYLPKPVLRASPSWLSPGASVALKCELEHPSAGWRFYWYQTLPDGSSYRAAPLPGTTTGTAEDSFTAGGQTRTARFACRAGRGAFHTHYSEPVFVWSGVSSAAASLSVRPAAGQRFFAESVSLSCEGNSSDWRVMRMTEAGPSRCQGWGIMAGATCTIPSLQHSHAVHWCESASGEFSNGVNITVRASRPDSASFTVTLLAGAIAGIFLVTLLLLVYWVAKSCGLCSSRSTQTQSSTNPDAAQEHLYSSLSQGDVCIYESIRSLGASGNDGRAEEQRAVKVQA